MARTFRNLVCVLAFSAGMAVPALALADVAPPNACTTAGVACNTAGSNYNQPGICTKTTCPKQLPDGGIMTYDCLLCLASDGGAAGGSGGAAAGGSGGAAAGGSSGASSGGAGTGGSAAKSSTSGSSGGCSLSAPAQGAGWTGLILLGGLGLLGFGRRRR